MKKAPSLSAEAAAGVQATRLEAKAELRQSIDGYLSSQPIAGYKNADHLVRFFGAYASKLLDRIGRDYLDTLRTREEFEEHLQQVLIPQIIKEILPQADNPDPNGLWEEVLSQSPAFSRSDLEWSPEGFDPRDPDWREGLASEMRDHLRSTEENLLAQALKKLSTPPKRGPKGDPERHKTIRDVAERFPPWRTHVGEICKQLDVENVEAPFRGRGSKERWPSWSDKFNKERGAAVARNIEDSIRAANKIDIPSQ